MGESVTLNGRLFSCVLYSSPMKAVSYRAGPNGKKLAMDGAVGIPGWRICKCVGCVATQENIAC